MSKIEIKTEKPDDGDDNDDSNDNDNDNDGNDDDEVANGQQPGQGQRGKLKAEKNLQPKLRLGGLPYPTTLIAASNRGAKGLLSPSPLAAQPAAKHSKRTSTPLSTRPKRSKPAAASSASRLPGARCGEIFVANNARKWTFICTFCNKTTRDIGDFICHIKIKHLQASDYAGSNGKMYDNDYGEEDDQEQDDDDGDEDDDEDDDYDRHQHPNQHPHRHQHQHQQPHEEHEDDQDYLDCGSYLDVNVHTEPGELSYAEHQYAKKSRNAGKQAQTAASAAAATTPVPTKTVILDGKRISIKEFQSKERKKPPPAAYVENRAEELAEADSVETISRHFASKSPWPVETSQHTPKQTGVWPRHDTTQDASMASYDGDPDGEVEPFVAAHLLDRNEVSKSHDQDEDDEHVGIGEDDEVGDYDSQLLIAPGESPLDTTSASDGNEVRQKRRQIRGTAYCVLCNKTFQYYSLYRNHMIKHSNETPFKCALCKKGFKSKQAIRYHMNTHQREKQYNCPICKLGFSVSNQYIAHVLTHEDANTFPCMVCGKVLGSEKERDLHLETHTEERPFRCEFCNKLFRLRHHLSNHLKMHRQYRCDFCKVEFTSAVHLRKPYACVPCEQLPEVKGLLQLQPAADSDPIATISTAHKSPEAIDLDEAYSESDDEMEAPSETQTKLLGPDEPASGQQAESTADPEQLLVDIYASRRRDGSLYVPATKPLPSGTEQKRLQCKYCIRTYSHTNGLNYHMRTKHSQ